MKEMKKSMVARKKSNYEPPSPLLCLTKNSLLAETNTNTYSSRTSVNSKTNTKVDIPKQQNEIHSKSITLSTSSPSTQQNKHHHSLTNIPLAATPSSSYNTQRKVTYAQILKSPKRMLDSPKQRLQ